MKSNRVTRFSSKTTGLLNFMDLKKIRFKILYWLMFAFMLLIALLCFLPVLWVALSGLKDMEEMFSVPPTIIPKTFHPEVIGSVWSQINVSRYFVNSLILIAGCWLCDVMVNGLSGYVLAKLKPMGSKVVETLVFWSMLLPGISMVPLYMTFVDLNLVGTYIPIWIMAGANAFNVLLFRNFFASIPTSYLEAARLDGCNDGGIFIRIILPLSKPIIMVVSIFIVTATWGNFLWPYLILGNTPHEPVSVMLYQMGTGQTGLQLNEYMVLLIISIIPMVIMYAIFSKQIMGGLDVGGIKG